MKAVKSILCLALSAVMLFSFAACGKKNNNNTVNSGSASAAVKYKDGEYKASANTYDDQGYKSTVKVTVKDGVLYSVNCDAESKDEGTKKAHSESGQYDMKVAGAKHDWHEEIALFEKYVVENGVDSIKIDNAGKTDTITGCTIAVSEYVTLIREALDKAKE